MVRRFSSDTINHTPTIMSDTSPQLLIDVTDDAQSETSIQDFLQPLQETAERVSQQVEDFASRVHRFKTDRPFDDDALWEDAWGMLYDFHDLAKRRLTNTGAGRPRAFSHRKSLGDTDTQTQKLQLEADLWILTKNLLMSNSPRAKADVAEAQATALGNLHRYSTNLEFWNAFLDSDTTAQEYETTLAWLQERAEQNSPPIENLIQNWTIESARGDGLWSAGPMFTKNAIKKQKRDRAWPLPLEPENPGVNMTLRRQTDGQQIVTQLDPDAPTRQGAFLEPQDEYHEQAAWLTCWELLRRGRPLSDIRAWWDERNEQWRSLLLRNSDPSSIDAVQSPWLRMMNLATNAEWHARCKALGTNEAVKDPFQQAVYGVLAGDASISNKVCETIDEYLFSEFNALLIGRYDLYLRAYRHKPAGDQLYQVPDSGSEIIKRFIDTAQTNANLKDELHEPHKLIELALMERDFDSFFVRMGRAAAQIAYIDGDFGFKKLIARDNTPAVSESTLLTAQDEDSVRIVAHLQLVLQTLGLLQKSSEQNREQLENNIVNYIGWLQKDQKWSLLPIYASKLSPERTRHVLGQILIEVTNDKERDAQVRLLKKYGIDVSEVIYGISSLSTYHQMTKYKNGKLRFRAPRFTERAGPRNTEQTRIRTAFMGDAPNDADMRLIHSMEWYRWIGPDKWGYACHHISLLYKYWLFEGNYEALKELSTRCMVSQISISAVEMNLRYADESQDDTYSDDEDVNMNGADGESAPKTTPRKKREQQMTHPLAREGTTRSQLYQKSLCWLQLEQLTLAIDALERWQDYANDTIE